MVYLFLARLRGPNEGLLAALMLAIDPVAHALVPVDSAAADALGAPNYDELQSDFSGALPVRNRQFAVKATYLLSR